VNAAPGSGARLFVALQYLLPQLALSRLIGAIARARAGWIRRPLIAAFMRGYRPDLSDAVESDPQAYPCFNAFFTRALRPDARPQPAAPLAIASPVDGRISALGPIRDGRLLQAKGHDYSLSALLAGDAAQAARYASGRFMTIYLAPFNYHRIHMALGGSLIGARFVPGRLFSVNDVTAQLVPGLFARNERVVLEFDSAHGPSALVLIGALFVGSMGTVWHGDIARPGAPGPTALPLPSTPAAARLERGAEVGRFNMGSTVILLLPSGRGEWLPELAAGSDLRLGQAIGSVAPAAP
jgi:phosphatidylserine decarboxylase